MQKELWEGFILNLQKSSFGFVNILQIICFKVATIRYETMKKRTYQLRIRDRNDWRMYGKQFKVEDFMLWERYVKVFINKSGLGGQNWKDNPNWIGNDNIF